MAQRLSSRCTKDLVKPAGMCWVIMIAGLLGGSGSSTWRMASVPPVEAPIITNFSVVEKGRAVSMGLRGPPLTAWRGREAAAARIRSEEHTSELQSRENLVCRLLLENNNEP